MTTNPDDTKCEHDDLENGHCIDCGEFIEDWYEKLFGYDPD